MAVTRNAPNTIHLGGPITRLNVGRDDEAVDIITPGFLLERHDNSGVPAWGVHDTADDPVIASVALEQTMENLGITDDYAVGDLVQVGILGPGATWFAIIPSGQDISVAELLQSNGDGKLKTHGTGVAVAVALDGPGAVVADTRIRVEVL